MTLWYPVRFTLYCLENNLTYVHVCNGYFKLSDNRYYCMVRDAFLSPVDVWTSPSGATYFPNGNGGPTSRNNGPNGPNINSSAAGPSSRPNINSSGASSSNRNYIISLFLFLFGILVVCVAVLLAQYQTGYLFLSMSCFN